MGMYKGFVCRLTMPAAVISRSDKLRLCEIISSVKFATCDAQSRCTSDEKEDSHFPV